MSEQNPQTCDPMFMSGTVTLVLDAPQQTITPSSALPTHFRSMQNIQNISGNAASGSAQYSRSQLQAAIDQKVVTTPLTVVDLRQEPHGFVEVNPALYGENEIAVGWFAERDWLNVGKGSPSISTDEVSRLGAAAQTTDLTVYQVLTKSPTEDGICTANPLAVKPTGAFSDELGIVATFPNLSYLRLPTTDHCRPRDHEVDQFVAFEVGLASNMWLHFHCRAGDGRTTTFMAMHDIFHNALTDTLATILTRQGPSGIGGIDLSKMPDPSGQDIFSYPFSVERVIFIQNFYAYVTAAKPGGFKLTWSEWVAESATRSQVVSA